MRPCSCVTSDHDLPSAARRVREGGLLLVSDEIGPGVVAGDRRHRAELHVQIRVAAPAEHPEGQVRRPGVTSSLKYFLLRVLPAISTTAPFSSGSGLTAVPATTN